MEFISGKPRKWEVFYLCTFGIVLASLLALPQHEQLIRVRHHENGMVFGRVLSIVLSLETSNFLFPETFVKDTGVLNTSMNYNAFNYQLSLF